MSDDSNRTKILMREYTESLVLAVIVAVLLRVFVVAAYKIPTSSMVPTLKVGDFIFAYKLPYGIPIPFSGGDRWAAQIPARGDVVVFRYPGNERVSYVKRVVGLPGDQISIKNKVLYINDKEAGYRAAPETLISDLPGAEYYSVVSETFDQSTHAVVRSKADDADFFGPVVVPPGHIFVLGDNRDSSDDSRYWGTVPAKNLEGRVVMIWMSFDWLKRWADDRLPGIRWERVFSSVH
ncbi:MAG TPA: signal peptidase I [Bdellovibrionales bacterium]|nr:signal peptidase I [Bdellovibrionales bacterium]